MRKPTRKLRSIKKKITAGVVIIGILTFMISMLLSYFIIIPSLRSDAIAKAEKANKEIIQQFDNQVSYIEDYAENLVLSAEHDPKIMNYFSRSTNQNEKIASINLNNLVSSEGLVRCVVIENEEGLRVDSMNKITSEDIGILDSSWYAEQHAAGYSRGISKVYQTKLNNTKYYSAAYLKNFYYGNQKYTYTVFFNLNEVMYDTKVIAGDTLDYYMLMDSTQNAFYLSGPEKWESEMEAYVSNEQAGNGRYTTTGEGISIKNTSINSKWCLVSFVSEQTIYRSFSRYVFSFAAGMLAFLIITLVTLPNVLAKIVKPISTLSAAMKKASPDNLGCQIEIESNDEVGELSHSFNNMMKELKNSVEIIAEKTKQEQKIKYSLLVAQIDPHFIYNTINSINYLARKGRCDDIIAVNSALIYILQDRLRVNDIEITDTIENEIKVIEQYICIQRYMYEGSLELQWYVDDSLLSEQIPKNMIQPLIENAIFHGLIDEENGNISGKIEIYIDRQGEEIVVRVKDNGSGIDPEKLALLQMPRLSFSSVERGKNIGLSNIRGRLFFLYGQSDIMRIESSPGEGTSITLRFKISETAS